MTVIGLERLTLTQVARQIGVHVATVWRWAGARGVRGRRLRTVTVGGRRFVLTTDLRTFLNHDQADDKQAHQLRADIASKLLDAKGIKPK